MFLCWVWPQRFLIFLKFPSISVSRHTTTTILFNRGNMATAASRYYSEDGRASKRQKTDGMDTVSLYLYGISFDSLYIFFLVIKMVTAAMCGFYSLNYTMTKCFTMDHKSLANIWLFGSVLLRERCLLKWVVFFFILVSSRELFRTDARRIQNGLIRVCFPCWASPGPGFVLLPVSLYVC